jgi:hypothetical protein
MKIQTPCGAGTAHIRTGEPSERASRTSGANCATKTGPRSAARSCGIERAAWVRNTANALARGPKSTTDAAVGERVSAAPVWDVATCDVPHPATHSASITQRTTRANNRTLSTRDYWPQS